MDGRDFFDRVAAHPELEWLGAREGRSPGAGAGADEVLIGHTRKDARRSLTSAVAVRAVLDHPWEELEAVLTGKRQAYLMTHLSRIVGYFSRVTNWNRSKIAELHDRHAGDYALGSSGWGGGDPPAGGDAGRRRPDRADSQPADRSPSAQGPPGRRAPALV